LEVLALKGQGITIGITFLVFFNINYPKELHNTTITRSCVKLMQPSLAKVDEVKL